MPPRSPIRPADLRGAARLATEATAGIADLVEAMHERIARLPGLPPPREAGRTNGITGLVYRTVRGVTRLTGGSLDALLGLLPPTLAGAEPVPQREALMAALNGVLGEHLAATHNPLAITMALRREGRALPMDAAGLAQALPQTRGHVLICIHGLCMNDLQWMRQGHDHGAALAQALGASVLYLHYNSGQPVATNGRSLAALLEQLFDAWPQPIQRLTLLGHSMGGLLARSAAYQGRQAGHRWPSVLRDMVFLGTPHHGAPLERAGHGVDLLLGATPYASPLARIGKLRSAGITDLRHGNLLEADRAGADRFARQGGTRQPVPLPADVRCYAVATTLGDAPGALKGRLLGDGLVPLDSALGRHKDAARSFNFPPQQQWTATGIGHLDLLSDARVAAQLLTWLRPD